MAAASYATDLQPYNDCTSTTDWGEVTGMADTDGDGDADTDLAIHGSTCITEAQRKTGLGSLSYTGTAPTWTAGETHYFIWYKFFAPNSLATETSGGIRVLVGSTTANYYGWYLNGSDSYPYGGWLNYVIDPEIGSPDQTQGSPSGTWNLIGIGANLINGISKGNSHTVDIIRYGRGESRFTNGDLANGYATFAGFAAVNDNATTGRWGLIQAIQGGYLYKGLMSLGLTATAVDFRDENTTINIDNTKKVSSSFNRIEIHHESSNVEMTAITFNALGTVSKGEFEMIDNATVNLEGCIFNDMSTFIFDSSGSLTDDAWVRCGQITQSGSTFDGCTFDRSVASTALLADDVGEISNCTFVSSGSGHAIELTPEHSGSSYSLSGCSFYDYATVDGSTGNEVIYNNSAGPVTINHSGTVGTITVRNGTDASTSVESSVDININIKDVNGDEIQNVQTAVYLTSDRSEIVNSDSDVNGEVAGSFSGTTPAEVEVRCRKASPGAAKYKAFSSIQTIGLVGLDLSVTLIEDSNNTST